MTDQKEISKTLHIVLWITQALLALLFIGTGIFKLVTPVAKIAAMWPWAAEFPDLLRLTGIVDLLGGTGIVLPMLAGLKPGLTILATLGCALLMASAIAFHLSRGEGANTPFNFIVLALTLFVFWGRRSKAPIHAKR